VWQGKSNAESIQSKAFQSTIYIVLGAQQLQVAVFAKGEWQTDLTMSMMSNADSAELSSNYAPWRDSLLSLPADLLAKQDTEFLSVTSKTKIHVAVSEQWLFTDTVPWSEALSKGNTHTAVAAYMQNSVSGFRFQDTVRCVNSHWGSARWAVAYPAILMESLLQFAQTMNGVLISVLPIACLAAQEATKVLPNTHLLAYIESNYLNLIEIERGRIISSMRRPLPVADSSNKYAEMLAVLQLWRSIQMRSPAWTAVTELPVLMDKAISIEGKLNGLKCIVWQAGEQSTKAPLLSTFHVISAEPHYLNAIANKQRIKIWQVIFLIITCVFVFCVGWKIALNQRAMQQIESSRAISQANAIINAPQSLSKLQQEKVLASNTAIRQLNFPVVQLLRALQPPKDIRVAILGLDLSDSGNESSIAKIKLNAETRSGEEMTRYVAFLSDRRPVVQAYLVRHEVMKNTPENPWRFTLELTWQP
jgi:hypothetical protein